MTDIEAFCILCNIANELKKANELKAIEIKAMLITHDHASLAHGDFGKKIDAILKETPQ